MNPLAKRTQSNKRHICPQHVLAVINICFSAVLVTGHLSRLRRLPNQSVGLLRAGIEIIKICIPST